MEGASCPCAARIRAECFLMPAAAASQQLSFSHLLQSPQGRIRSVAAAALWEQLTE